MANNYAQISETLPDHPKTTRVVRALRCDRYKIVGHLSALWNWAIKNRIDGDLSGLPSRDISDAARWTSPDDFSEAADASAEAFVRALVDDSRLNPDQPDSHGFLERDGEGLHIHDWHEFGGRLNEKRLRSAFSSWILRVKNGGVIIPNNDETFHGWLSDRETLRKQYADGGNPPRTNPKPSREKSDIPTSSPPSLASSSRDDHGQITCYPNIAERSVAEQNETKRSVEKQQQSREESVRGDDTPNEKACLPDFSQSEERILPAQILPLEKSPMVADSPPRTICSSRSDFSSLTDSSTPVTTSIPVDSPPGVLSPDFSGDLVGQLVEQLSINRSDAVRFAADRPDECRRQLAHEPFFKGEYTTGKGAYWRRAIEERYDPPKGFTAAQERRADQDRRIVQEGINRRRTAADEERRNQENAAYELLLQSVRADGKKWGRVETEARSIMTGPLLAKLDSDPGFKPAIATFQNLVRKIILRDYSFPALSGVSGQVQSEGLSSLAF